MSALDLINIPSEHQRARQYNTVVIGNTSSLEEDLYKARMTNDVSLETVLDFSSNGLLGSIGMADFLKIGIQAMGYVPGIDMPKLYCFNGSSAPSLKLNTLLRLRTSVVEDYVNPLSKLVDYALPRRYKSLQSAIDDTANVGSSRAGELLGRWVDSFLGLICSGLQVIRDAVDSISNDMVSNILENSYILEAPKQLPKDISKTGVYVFLAQESQENNQFTFRFGPYVITGIRVNFGPLVMSGGYPEYIKVDIDLQSTKTFGVASDFIDPFQKEPTWNSKDSANKNTMV